MASLCLSVHPRIRRSTWNNTVSFGGIFIKFNIRDFFLNSVWKIQFSLKSDTNSGYFTGIRTVRTVMNVHTFHKNLSLNSPLNEQHFRKQELYRKSKHTF